jgi:hypothetical protein
MPIRPMPGRLRASVRLTSSRRFALVPLLVSLTALAACGPDEPTAPSSATVPHLTPINVGAAISDALRGSGGDPHFYWLPPIVPDTIYGGTFDPGLQPEIRICRVSLVPCTAPLVTFPSGTIAGNAATQSYSVVWSTKPSNITLDDYRAEVWIAARKMGFADIRVVSSAKDLRNVPAGFAGVLKSKSLTLAFRLELGIVAGIEITPRNPAIDSATTVQLSATVRDFHNDVIPNAVVTWTSAPASVATVSSTGLVTGVAPGTAVVTASSGGTFAADTITVRRPLADWSGAVEWTTYQGNASHTGYNPVLMDVGVFQELWSRSVSTAALNPVTAGDGKVFVTTNAYFGIQQAKALDARTGGELWSKDFGSIHSVHPPAYANGVVYLQTGGHGDSFLWALDATNASVRFQTPYLNQWSRYFAPVIVGTSVYVAGGYYGGMYAFSATEGVQRWFASLNQYDQFTPAVSNGLVYAYTGSYSPKLTVADATTGAIAYEIADPGFVWDGWSMNTAPTLGRESNVLATNGGRLISFNLQTRSIGYALTASFRGQPTVADGVVYVVNGAQVEARQELDGSLVWSWTPPTGQPVGPMIATKNLLFVSTAANTYAVDRATRQQVWSYPAGGHLALSAQGILFIAQSSGRLVAISVR